MSGRMTTNDGINTDVSVDYAYDFEKIPTATVHQSRIQMYEPTRRPSDRKRVIVTSWGTATITGKLGQGQADVFEAICWQPRDWRMTDTGGLELLVDPFKVRKTANGGSLGSGQQLLEVTKDLMRVIVELDIPKRGIRIRGHIIDQIVESVKTVTGRGFGKDKKQGEPRHLWKVTLGSAYLALMNGDLPLHYDPTKISALQCGVSQAVARHVATHRNEPPGGWHLNDLLATIGADDPRKLGNRRRDLKKDTDGLAALGINIGNGRVTGPRQRNTAIRTSGVANANHRASNA